MNLTSKIVNQPENDVAMGELYLKTNGGASSPVLTGFLVRILVLRSFCFLKRPGTLNKPENRNTVTLNAAFTSIKDK